MEVGNDQQVRARRTTTIAMRKIQMRRHLNNVMYDLSPTGLAHPAQAQLLVEELLTESQSQRTQTIMVHRRLHQCTLLRRDMLWSGVFMSSCVEMCLQTQRYSLSASIESMC